MTGELLGCRISARIADLDRHILAAKRDELRQLRWQRRLTTLREKHEIELKLTWYEATRHSFVSRNLAAGASLEEVSSAIGHSSPVVTQRFYNRFVRKQFSSTLRAGLGLKRKSTKGRVLKITPPASAAEGDEVQVAAARP